MASHNTDRTPGASKGQHKKNGRDWDTKSHCDVSDGAAALLERHRSDAMEIIAEGRASASDSPIRGLNPDGNGEELPQDMRPVRGAFADEADAAEIAANAMTAGVGKSDNKVDPAEVLGRLNIFTVFTVIQCCVGRFTRKYAAKTIKAIPTLEFKQDCKDVLNNMAEVVTRIRERNPENCPRASELVHTIEALMQDFVKAFQSKAVGEQIARVLQHRLDEAEKAFQRERDWDAFISSFKFFFEEFETTLQLNAPDVYTAWKEILDLVKTSDGTMADAKRLIKERFSLKVANSELLRLKEALAAEKETSLLLAGRLDACTTQLSETEEALALKTAEAKGLEAQLQSARTEAIDLRTKKQAAEQAHQAEITRIRDEAKANVAEEMEGLHAKVRSLTKENTQLRHAPAPRPTASAKRSGPEEESTASKILGKLPLFGADDVLEQELETTREILATTKKEMDLLFVENAEATSKVEELTAQATMLEAALQQQTNAAAAFQGQVKTLTAKLAEATTATASAVHQANAASAEKLRAVTAGHVAEIGCMRKRQSELEAELNQAGLEGATAASGATTALANLQLQLEELRLGRERDQETCQRLAHEKDAAERDAAAVNSQLVIAQNERDNTAAELAALKQQGSSVVQASAGLEQRLAAVTAERDRALAAQADAERDSATVNSRLEVLLVENANGAAQLQALQQQGQAAANASAGFEQQLADAQQQLANMTAQRDEARRDAALVQGQMQVAVANAQQQQQVQQPDPIVAAERNAYKDVLEATLGQLCNEKNSLAARANSELQLALSRARNDAAAMQQ